MTAHALSTHVSQMHGSGGPVSNGSGEIPLPVVSKGAPMEEAEVIEEDDEEEAMRISVDKLISSIKQEVVQNVKAETGELSAHLLLFIVSN